MQNIYVQQYIFWTNIWKHHLKWDFLCIEEFVKTTEKKNVKCHDFILTIYILLTAFGIIMLYIRQECNYEVSLIKRRISLRA